MKTRNLFAGLMAERLGRSLTRPYGALLAGAALYLGAFVPPQAYAVPPPPPPCTTTVTTNADNGFGSLRAALACATNGATINFSLPTPTSITLTSGELLVTNNVTILGPGVNQLAINGNAASRVFHIRSNTVTIASLTITNGVATNSFPDDAGGGIYNDQSTLIVSNCTLSGNLANFGGGILSDGLSNSVSLTVINSTLSDNTANDAGGGIYNFNSTLTILNSTLSDNFANGDGGGIYNDGFNSGSATLTILSSTLSGNSALSDSDDIFNDGSSSGSAKLAIGSTILDSFRSIANLAGTVTSRGYNLSSGDGGGFLTATGDQTNTPPQLGPLQNNGGPTFTLAPLCNSPAIDRGTNFTGAATDQRGFPRKFGVATDIGAVEVQAPLTFTVSNTNNAGPGSLRQAILDANTHPGADTITFAPGVTNTITLTTGELDITDCLFLNGPGPTVLAVNGNHAGRVFAIWPNTVVTIAGLTITNGFASGASYEDIVGGGILNYDATLTVSNCTVAGNVASNGGGIYSILDFGDAMLTVFNSTLSGNVATNDGGGVYNDGADLTILNSTLRGNSATNDAGGGIFNNGEYGFATAVIRDSTLSSNTAGDAGGGILNDGENGYAALTVLSSTLVGNSAYGSGGGIYNDGYNGTAMVYVVDSTLSSNSATNDFPGGSGGGILNDGGYGYASLSILNSTLSGNSANSGGGIFNVGYSGTASLAIGSTILNAGPSGGTITNDSGTVVSSGFNLSSDAAGGNGSTGPGGWLNAPGDIRNTNPLLDPAGLQNNGGPTLTILPLCGSPAIDQGKRLSQLVTDQRGFPRTFDDPGVTNAVGGDGTDIGAVEVHDTIPPTITCPGDITHGTDLGQCGAVVTFTVVAIDNCGTATLVCSHAPGSFFNQGITPVTCTATDRVGNTNSCSFNVTVTQPATCGITVSGDSLGTVLCPGRTAILTAPNGKKRYLWHGPEKDGATVQTIVVGTQGLYTCTQENWYDGTNCCSVYITVLPAPGCPISHIGSLGICPGQTVTLVGPAGMKSQYWLGPQNNGLNTRSNTVSVVGTYTLHVVTSNGCENACSVPVTRPSLCP